jgi:putative SOS response-associated peptidase YedK
MCGRYELHSHPATIALTFGLSHPPILPPRFNITPMTDVPIVRVNADGERELVHVRWGLVPRWARNPSIGARLINVRGETIADKPSFQMPFRRHRCLMPADGFYEWMPAASADTDSPRKQPVRVAMKDGTPFGLAAIFERWRGTEGEILDTCSIVTIGANAMLKTVHDRMPVIIAPGQFSRWLDPANDEVGDLLAPFPSEAMCYYPVSTRVNSVHHDDATLIECVTPMPPVDGIGADDTPSHVPEQESLF